MAASDSAAARAQTGSAAEPPGVGTKGEASGSCAVEMPKRRICVIGAGASGMPAMKACLEAGAEVVCLERTSAMGGLWNFRTDLPKGLGTVMKSTIINTSKEMMAYSDFPPPASYPNFMHNAVLNEYLQAYADHFRLRQHVRFQSEVLSVRKAEKWSETGEVLVRWRQVAKTLDGDEASEDEAGQDGEVTEEPFHGVMVCTGHHAVPWEAPVKGRDTFPGNVRHSQELREAAELTDKRVLVVGLGNSAIDAAVELSRVAKKVLLSTRRGAWLWNRVSENGFPHDIWYMSRFKHAIMWFVGRRISNLYVQHNLNKRFDHAMYGLRPQHGFFNAHPAVNDVLPNCLCSGVVTLKGDIATLGKDGSARFVDGSEEAVDEVVLCTGYKMALPFLDKDLLEVTENRLPLYKYVFPLESKWPSVALIGFIQPIGAIQPIAELQARWAAAVMTGSVTLPSREAMERDVLAKEDALRRRYFASPKHTVQVDYVPFMDELAKELGCHPVQASLMVRDPSLLWQLLVGPSTPYAFRLTGPGKWPGAREAVMGVEERVRAPLGAGRRVAKPSSRRPAMLGLTGPKEAVRVLVLGLGVVGLTLWLCGMGWSAAGAVAGAVALTLLIALFDVVYDVSALL